MKLGINLYLWTDHMHAGLLPVLESLKQIGYDGVEVPIFDLDEAKWEHWGQVLDDLGLERTANTVIAPEWNPLSPDPAVQEAAYQHMPISRKRIRRPPSGARGAVSFTFTFRKTTGACRERAASPGTQRSMRSRTSATTAGSPWRHSGIPSRISPPPPRSGESSSITRNSWPVTLTPS